MAEAREIAREICVLGGVVSSLCTTLPALTAQAQALAGPGLVITEVAQATLYAGSSADKVEVFCASSSGCPAFRVCDGSGAEGSCSALQPALAAQARAVISRGTSILASDQVWLNDAAGQELTGTRVGPFACAAGSSQARADCAQATFGVCGAASLGIGSGTCDPNAPGSFHYSLLFTKNQHGAPESSCTRPVCQQLLAAIAAAQQSIDFAIYGVRAQLDIIAALVAAQGRGVLVRGVVDAEDANCSVFGYPDTPLLMGQLTPGSVVCDAGPGYSYIMHDKFFVLDGARVWTGSTNISDTELGGEYHSDVAALLDVPALAQIYSSEFEELFAGICHNRKLDDTDHVLGAETFSDGTLLESYFSPSDDALAHAVLRLIEGATTSLDIAMFFFTSQPAADAILAAHARGVSVRMILDASGAANVSSKHHQLCADGIPVKVENWGGKSHSKWAVADAGLSGATVVFGSMNWTASGDEQNDENTLYVRHANFAASFRDEFARQWQDLSGVASCTQ